MYIEIIDKVSSILDIHDMFFLLFHAQSFFVKNVMKIHKNLNL